MTDTPTTGLRDLPLYQYLLRGKRSDIVAQYEELQRLRKERVAALTLLSVGPFRLFIFKNQEEMLRKIGKDRRSVVASLNQGLEVVGVEPARTTRTQRLATPQSRRKPSEGASAGCVARHLARRSRTEER
jgi:hypothetical protein